MKISEQEKDATAKSAQFPAYFPTANDAPGRVMAEVDALPHVANRDAGAIMISEWAMPAPERQPDAADAIAAAWSRASHPANLLSYHVFPSIDGGTLLHYSQWTSEAAFHAFVEKERDPRIDRIDAAVPGIERYGLGSYRLYRSHVPRVVAPATGCIVVVRVEADGPERQQAWVDTVIEALSGDCIPGLVSAHFHLCNDGRRIVNYAQWESEDAHQKALESGGPGITQADSAAWQRVRTMPGITQMGFKRYALPRRIAGSSPVGMTTSGQRK